jgi:TRAP-type C4-dicarboxylate transport system permease small subunit
MLLLWRSLLVAGMVTITVTVLLGIVARYIFNAPLLWTDELSRIALVWVMFLGIAELFRIKHGHVAITALSDWVGGLAGTLIRAAATILVVLMLVAMIVGGLVLANPSRPSTSAALGVPMWILYAVVPFSGALSIIFLLYFRTRQGSADPDGR